MKILPKALIAALPPLLLPLAAAAQDSDPRLAAQEVIRAEIIRWHFPLVEGDDRYPDILGTNTPDPLIDPCLSNYTIRYEAFNDGDRDHPAVERPVPMKWRYAGRLARRDGSTVILTWRLQRGGKASARPSDATFDWRLDMETPARATAFAEAANVLINACITQPLIED